MAECGSCRMMRLRFPSNFVFQWNVNYNHFGETDDEEDTETGIHIRVQGTGGEAGNGRSDTRGRDPGAGAG
jgi:hypothetical protein